MTRFRWLILVVGPVPIVAASLGVTHWFRGGSTSVVAVNQVLADEVPPPSSTDATRRRIESYLDDQCQASADKLREQLGAGCAVAVRTPFVLAGDLNETQLDEHYRATIAPAARALANAYFRKSPTLPITILLFSGEASYHRYAKQLFNEEGVSVYGYYKPDRRTLVMNIATGGGTLVHELTHALVDFDFPRIPDWFNEGLASLYEQCRFLPDDSGLEGLPNWRLPGLQETIRQGRLGTLEGLATGDDFRGPNVGVNYAQARYFCLYLQERDLLREFYRRFRAAHEQDPRGTETLRAVVGDEAWSTLDRDFQAWVLTLSH